MAKVIKNPSALKADFLFLKAKLKKRILFLLGFILVAILGNIIMKADFLYNIGMIFVGVSVVGFLVSLFMVMSTSNEVTIKGQGLLGEDETAEILAEGLDNSYTVIQNVVVTLEGKSSELDLVVLGPNGVFVIEAKNRNGLIEGGYDKDKWLQHKVGRRGGEYSSEFYSPIKQVGTHIFRLAGHLRQNNIRFHICGAVYFSNPEAKVRLSGEPDKIPVFWKPDELILYIKMNNANLPLETKEAIIDLLK